MDNEVENSIESPTSTMELDTLKLEFKKLEKEKDEYVLNETLLALNSKSDELKALTIENAKIRAECDDIKTAAAISEASREDEMDIIGRKAREEVASIQHIMKEAVEQARQVTAQRLQNEISLLEEKNSQLQKELAQLREKLSEEREGFLSSVAKSLQKKVQVAATELTGGDAEDLENSMKKAQDEAEWLRSVVMPLEEEIGMLKKKLRTAYDELDAMKGKGFADTDGSAGKSKIPVDELEEKVRELNRTLETEKASRTDLEMYVAVLNTQKTVLQDDADKLRGELHEVCRLLELEKRDHTELKRTWQMANDQFLQSQRLMMMDLRRMEGLLSAEQQRQVAVLKKEDAEREAQEKKLKELEELRRQEEEERAKRAAEEKFAAASSGASDEVARLEVAQLLEGAGLPLSRSSTSLASATFDDTSSPDRVSNVTLTAAQQRAITDPTPEAEESQTLLAHARSRLEQNVNPGGRLVSEAEWEKLQSEVKAAREKLGRPCDMCHNYESQLQSVQDAEKKCAAQLRTLERQLQSERQVISSQQKYSQELEEQLNKVAKEVEQQISPLMEELKTAESHKDALQKQFHEVKQELHDQLKALSNGRREANEDLVRLQEENDSLVGKTDRTAQEMRDEVFNLPDKMEDLHLLLLNYHEEMIRIKVAKDHVEQKLTSENHFIKAQMVDEQQQWRSVEDALNQDIQRLTHDLTVLQSVKSEIERVSQEKQETETKLQEKETQLQKVQGKGKQIISALQTQIEDHKKDKVKLEDDSANLKAKVQSLQNDLDNSEAVQRDFVKLSQSLQIQLEKIRAGETEVRWQHDDDVTDCNSCKQTFGAMRRKTHCRHCGKIYCTDCTAKVVQSGPKQRPSRVCDVCHTLLNKEAQPFFSKATPLTPD